MGPDFWYQSKDNWGKGWSGRSWTTSFSPCFGNAFFPIFVCSGGGAACLHVCAGVGGGLEIDGGVSLLPTFIINAGSLN